METSSRDVESQEPDDGVVIDRYVRDNLCNIIDNHLEYKKQFGYKTCNCDFCVSSWPEERPETIAQPSMSPQYYIPSSPSQPPVCMFYPPPTPSPTRVDGYKLPTPPLSPVLSLDPVSPLLYMADSPSAPPLAMDQSPPTPSIPTGEPSPVATKMPQSPTPSTSTTPPKMLETFQEKGDSPPSERRLHKKSKKKKKRKHSRSPPASPLPHSSHQLTFQSPWTSQQAPTSSHKTLEPFSWTQLTSPPQRMKLSPTNENTAALSKKIKEKKKKKEKKDKHDKIRVNIPESSLSHVPSPPKIMTGAVRSDGNSSSQIKQNNESKTEPSKVTILILRKTEKPSPPLALSAAPQFSPSPKTPQDYIATSSYPISRKTDSDNSLKRPVFTLPPLSTPHISDLEYPETTPQQAYATYHHKKFEKGKRGKESIQEERSPPPLFVSSPLLILQEKCPPLSSVSLTEKNESEKGEEDNEVKREKVNEGDKVCKKLILKLERTPLPKPLLSPSPWVPVIDQEHRPPPPTPGPATAGRGRKMCKGRRGRPRKDDVSSPKSSELPKRAGRGRPRKRPLTPEASTSQRFVTINKSITFAGEPVAVFPKHSSMAVTPSGPRINMSNAAEFQLPPKKRWSAKTWKYEGNIEQPLDRKSSKTLPTNNSTLQSAIPRSSTTSGNSYINYFGSTQPPHPHHSSFMGPYRPRSSYLPPPATSSQLKKPFTAATAKSLPTSTSNYVPSGPAKLPCICCSSTDGDCMPFNAAFPPPFSQSSLPLEQRSSQPSATFVPSQSRCQTCQMQLDSPSSPLENNTRATSPTEPTNHMTPHFQQFPSPPSNVSMQFGLKKSLLARSSLAKPSTFHSEPSTSLTSYPYKLTTTAQPVYTYSSFSRPEQSMTEASTSFSSARMIECLSFLPPWHFDIYNPQTPLPSNSQSALPSNSQTPRPSNSQTPRPSTSQTPLPFNSQSPRPSNSQYALPSNSQTPRPPTSQTPRPSTLQTPRPSTSQTPRPSNSQTPRPSTSQTPRPSTSQTPRPSTSQTPRPSNSQTPRPSTSQTPLPFNSQTPRPSNSQTPRPPTSQTPRPSTSQTPRPSTSQTPRPSTSQTPRPSTSQTPRPSTSQTPRPSTSQAPQEDNPTDSRSAFRPWTKKPKSPPDQ